MYTAYREITAEAVLFVLLGHGFSCKKNLLKTKIVKSGQSFKYLIKADKKYFLKLPLIKSYFFFYELVNRWVLKQCEPVVKRVYSFIIFIVCSNTSKQRFENNRISYSFWISW